MGLEVYLMKCLRLEWQFSVSGLYEIFISFKKCIHNDVFLQLSYTIAQSHT